jgi:hypothetical protein
MVHAGVRHLRKAFQRHRQPGLEQKQSRILLLFYAVECGLKAAWLARSNLQDTSAMEARFKDQGHDLRLWAKELRLPAAIANSRTHFRLRDGSCHGLEVAHQVWRYGVDMDPADEDALEGWLEQVWEWAKEELSL